MLMVQQVSKKYGDHVAAENISFTLKPGEVLGLLGANGAGKSTILNIISGYFAPSEGSVSLNGMDSVLHPMEYKKQIGYLPEMPPLYPEMTAREQLLMVCTIKGFSDAEKVLEVERVSRLCRIEDVLNRRNLTMSKGYKQRIGLAQALIGNPLLLILDEPTAGLDPQQILEFRQLIQEMGTGQMLIISSHILSEIATVSSRVLVLRNGLIAADSTTENIGDIPGGATLLEATISGDADLVSTLIEGLSGVASVEKELSDESGCMDYHITMKKGSDVRKSLFKILADNNCPLMGLKVRKPTLEDFFIRSTMDIRG